MTLWKQPKPLVSVQQLTGTEAKAAGIGCFKSPPNALPTTSSHHSEAWWHLVFLHSAEFSVDRNEAGVLGSWNSPRPYTITCLLPPCFGMGRLLVGAPAHMEFTTYQCFHCWDNRSILALCSFIRNSYWLIPRWQPLLNLEGSRYWSLKGNSRVKRPGRPFQIPTILTGFVDYDYKSEGRQNIQVRFLVSP